MLRGMTERANTRLHDGPAATTTAVPPAQQQKKQWQHSATASLATTIQATPDITSTNSNSSPCTSSTSRACASSISRSRCNGNDGHTRIYSASKIGDDGKTNQNNNIMSGMKLCQIQSQTLIIVIKLVYARDVLTFHDMISVTPGYQ